MNLSSVLSVIPAGLRDPLLAEYGSILSHYLERKWQPSELSGGLFSEIVYSILDGHGKNAYPSKPSKPKNFVAACTALENHTNAPRSFRILIPRVLVGIYEVRNNRNVGHVGGDVDPNEMDASLVLNSTTWVMAELIRVFHQLSVADAQQIVDKLIERKTPLVWESGNIKRILNPKLKFDKQILILLAITNGGVKFNILQSWLEQGNTTYLKKILKSLHQKRFVEWNQTDDIIVILPPGLNEIEPDIQKHVNA
jgi:hypothetical protein